MVTSADNGKRVRCAAMPYAHDGLSGKAGSLVRNGSSSREPSGTLCPALAAPQPLAHGTVQAKHRQQRTMNGFAAQGAGNENTAR